MTYSWAHKFQPTFANDPFLQIFIAKFLYYVPFFAAGSEQWSDKIHTHEFERFDGDDDRFGVRYGNMVPRTRLVPQDVLSDII